MRMLLTALVLAIGSGSMAQDSGAPRVRKDPRSFSDRIWFGGGAGVSFGTLTSVQLDPMVGYKVDQAGKFSVGLGGSYWYLQDNRFPLPRTFTGYGYRVFSRYRVIPQIFLHTEFLHLNVQQVRNNPVENPNTRIWVPHWLVGGGYSQSLGGRSAIYFQVLFDVLQDPNSVYANQGPIISGGIGVGF